jgi:hypothetical protein
MRKKQGDQHLNIKGHRTEVGEEHCALFEDEVNN